MAELITSRRNEKIRYAARLSSSASERSASRLFLAEGARLCSDAARSGLPIASLFYTEEARGRYADYLDTIVFKADACYEVSPHVAELLSGTQSPQGIFCICSMPERAQQELSHANLMRRYIALERIQDPGNLGTILRTAEALGLGGVILAGGGCDPYGPKALRASMGAIFRLPVYLADNMAEAALQLREAGVPVYAAVPDSAATRITEIAFTGPSVIVIGNEGGGLSPATLAAASAHITIPMRGRAESLNAAASAAILMWEQTRNWGDCAK